MNTLSKERLNWSGLLGTLFSVLGGIGLVALAFWLVRQIDLYTIRERGITIGDGDYFSSLFLVSLGAVLLCGLLSILCFCLYDRRDSPRRIKAINWAVAVALGFCCIVWGLISHESVNREITEALANRLIRIETDSWRMHLLWPSVMPLIASLGITFLCTTIFRPRGYPLPFWLKRKDRDG